MREVRLKTGLRKSQQSTTTTNANAQIKHRQSCSVAIQSDLVQISFSWIVEKPANKN